MKILAEVEAEDFLEKNRFPVTKRAIAKTEEQTIATANKIGYPIALKIIGKNIILFHLLIGILECIMIKNIYIYQQKMN